MLAFRYILRINQTVFTIRIDAVFYLCVRIISQSPQLVSASQTKVNTDEIYQSLICCLLSLAPKILLSQRIESSLSEMGFDLLIPDRIPDSSVSFMAVFKHLRASRKLILKYHILNFKNIWL